MLALSLAGCSPNPVDLVKADLHKSLVKFESELGDLASESSTDEVVAALNGPTSPLMATHWDGGVVDPDLGVVTGNVIYYDVQSNDGATLQVMVTASIPTGSGPTYDTHYGYVCLRAEMKSVGGNASRPTFSQDKCDQQLVDAAAGMTAYRLSELD